MTTPIDRRHLLKGAGIALALPWLDAMIPTWATRASAAPVPKAPPLRLGFVYVPNGVHLPQWTPATEGSTYEMPTILGPLAPYRDRLLVLSGLAHAKANANGDGPGDHARAGATFLTGAQAKKTSGSEIRVGVSVDQVAAQAVGAETAFPSLEVGCEPGAVSGDCDSGYSCAYSSNLSWRTPSSPNAKEIDPQAVFDRLFGDPFPGTPEERKARRRRRASILDFVLGEAKSLRGRLGSSDQHKVDEYLEGVRSVEARLARSAATEAQPVPAGTTAKGRLLGGKDQNGGRVPYDADGRPIDEPRDFAEHVTMMGDLIALAFQGDVTRVASFLVANEGSNRSYASLGVPEGHHGLSHHGGEVKAQGKIARINRFHMELFAKLVSRLASMSEGEGTVLDHTLIVYGSAIGDGNRHNHDDLPIVLVGGGNGTVKTGRHLRVRGGTPVANLYVSLLDRMGLDRVGVRRDSFGDSTGRLELA